MKERDKNNHNNQHKVPVLFKGDWFISVAQFLLALAVASLRWLHASMQAAAPAVPASGESDASAHFFDNERMAVATAQAESLHHSVPPGRGYELKHTAKFRMKPSPRSVRVALRDRLRAGPRYRSAGVGARTGRADRRHHSSCWVEALERSSRYSLQGQGSSAPSREAPPGFFCQDRVHKRFLVKVTKVLSWNRVRTRFLVKVIKVLSWDRVQQRLLVVLFKIFSKNRVQQLVFEWS